MSFFYKNLVFLLFVISNGGSFAYAMSSSLTPRIVGHKPIASNVKIDNENPILGERLIMSYQYSDADNDVEDEPLIAWYYNGKKVSNQTKSTYQPIFDPVTGVGVECNDVGVKVSVVPRSKSGDPLLGEEQSSEDVVVKVIFDSVPGYIKPTAATFNWSEANAYCKAKGARLPTVAELKQLFKMYSTAPSSYEMSTKYGWPLQSARCGGSSNSYWTSDSGIMAPHGEKHYDVSLFDGSEFIHITDNSPYHVACKID
ncbi:MAG: adhesion domain-containing protein [Plesiomonas sp.]|uniref:adhesion domain-containing protein n=1 Tax=Plesiomonas sp. TaxID=2486279 RepID=UPI003F2C1F91